MAIEYQAHIHNNTGKLTPAPTNRHIIRCKWVFKLKRKLDDSIDRYKAQLVAEGFHQTQGLDYFDTFRPMVKVATIRIVLTVALSFRWTIRQLDVQNSFLNSDLRERVFLQHPPSFEDPKHPTHMCCLNKTIYGLKRAPRAWFLKLKIALLKWGLLLFPSK